MIRSRILFIYRLIGFLLEQLYYIYILLTLKPLSRRYIKGLISKSIKYTNLLDYD